MSRSYGSVRPKANRVYAVDEVLDLYDICRNTLSNWIRAGLRPIEDTRPQLFRGAELKWFHEERRRIRRRKLRSAEFKCVTCDGVVIPDIGTVRIEPSNHRHFWATAVCPKCSGKASKLLNASACITLRNCMNTNTSPHILDEEEAAAPAGVGTKPGQTRPKVHPENESVIHAYQVYAGRFDTRTLDAHLASIRDFEGFCEGRAFGSVTEKVAGAYRANLIARGEAELSRSTIRHRASHLKAFFAWLVQQDGYRRMNRTIGDYFLLPRKLSARTLQPDPRPFPTSDEVHRLLTGMPTNTLIERRDRAIVAASFLFGSRASATASLRLGCVDVERQKVYQDATIVRVKNGKSQTTTWFPNVDPADEIVKAWIEELVQLSCGPNDALFPPDAALASPNHIRKPGRAPIEPWKADRGIGRAFGLGCTASGLPDFNPHSARHYLKWLGDQRCRNRIERRAWSHNMGHETEQITEVNYAKMTDDQRDEIFASLTTRDDATEDDKDLLIAFYEYRLTPGTPELERATRLANARRQRRDEQNG